MPQKSKKAQVLEELKEEFNRRILARAVRSLESDSDSFDDAVDEAAYVTIVAAHTLHHSNRCRAVDPNCALS
jgi:predicted AAA+ superfamily ATPase